MTHRPICRCVIDAPYEKSPTDALIEYWRQTPFARRRDRCLTPISTLLGVLAGQLRRRRNLFLPVLTVEARVTAPRALELVLHVEPEPAHTFDLQLDLVAVLEG